MATMIRNGVRIGGSMSSETEEKIDAIYNREFSTWGRFGARMVAEQMQNFPFRLNK